MLSVKRLTKPKHSINILELDLLQFNLLQRWKELARNLLFVDYYCLTSNCCLSGVKKKNYKPFNCSNLLLQDHEGSLWSICSFLSGTAPVSPLHPEVWQTRQNPYRDGAHSRKEWLLSSSSALSTYVSTFLSIRGGTTHLLQVSLWGPHQRRPTNGEIAQVLSHAQDCRQKELPMGHQKVWGPASKPPEVSFLHL